VLDAENFILPSRDVAWGLRLLWKFMAVVDLTLSWNFFGNRSLSPMLAHKKLERLHVQTWKLRGVSSHENFEVAPPREVPGSPRVPGFLQELTIELRLEAVNSVVVDVLYMECFLVLPGAVTCWTWRRTQLETVLSLVWIQNGIDESKGESKDDNMNSRLRIYDDELHVKTSSQTTWTRRRPEVVTTWTLKF
jgi:hypothetical protein